MSNLFDKKKSQEPTKQKEKWEIEEEEVEKIKEKMMREAADKYKKDYLLSEIQFKILKIIREHPYKTQKKYGELVGISQPQISHHIKQIIKNNPELKWDLKKNDMRVKYKIYRV